MINKRRKTVDVASLQFYKFDKWLLAEKQLKKLSPTAKILYMVIKDREEISLKNADKFTDKEGYLFQYFDQEKASELIGVSLTAIKKAFKDLVEYGLIESVRQGLGKPNRLYVLDYEVSESTVKELSYKNKKSPTSAKVKDTNKFNVNNSICNSKDNNTSVEENKEVKVVKELTEVEKAIKDSGVNIKKADIEECINTFTDIDRLNKALRELEKTNSHGIKALRVAYNKIGSSNEQKTDFVNNFAKPKTPAHKLNQTFNKYEADELEELILANSKRKFVNNFKD